MSQPGDSSREPSHPDPFAPPPTPCEVQCVHCGQSYESWRIEWRDAPDAPKLAGAWCCPTPGCDGIGFGFDIFPVDPKWVDETGEPMMAFFTDEEQEELDELDFDDGDEDEDEDLDEVPTVGLGIDDEDEEDVEDGMSFETFEADSFWLDIDALMPPPLGNTPQSPFDGMSSPKKPWSAYGQDDIPF